MNSDWVLTAGHCCNGLDGGEIAAGINDRFDNENAQVSTFTMVLHPDYNGGNTNNDVCLLKLDTPLNLTDKVQTIGLNRKDDWEKGVMFTVSGWGTLTVSNDKSKV